MRDLRNYPGPEYDETQSEYTFPGAGKLGLQGLGYGVLTVGLEYFAYDAWTKGGIIPLSQASIDLGAVAAIGGLVTGLMSALYLGSSIAESRVGDMFRELRYRRSTNKKF